VSAAVNARMDQDDRGADEGRYVEVTDEYVASDARPQSFRKHFRGVTSAESTKSVTRCSLGEWSTREMQRRERERGDILARATASRRSMRCSSNEIRICVLDKVMYAESDTEIRYQEMFRIQMEESRAVTFHGYSRVKFHILKAVPFQNGEREREREREHITGKYIRGTSYDALLQANYETEDGT